MNIKDKIYEIIDKYDESGQVDECVEEIEETLTNNKEGVLRYKTYVDTDVFDSCGLDIYYISVAYIDSNNDLHIIGDRLTNQ